MNKKQKQKARIKLSYRWHRRIGVVVALPLLLLSITGIALNHEQIFKLDETYIDSPLILDWYQVSPIEEPKAIKIDQTWVTLLDDTLYLNTNRKSTNFHLLIGASKLGEIIAVADERSLMLFTADSFELIERVNRAALPPGKIQAISAKSGRLAIDTTAGQYIYDELIQQYSSDAIRPPISPPVYSQISPKLRSEIIADWRSQGVSIWRLILDIHTGRVFGQLGTLINDLAALCILLLVASGLYNWNKRPTR